MGFLLAADTGGTFTDLAAYDRLSGQMTYTKSLTTYGDLVEGVMDCVRKARIELADVDLIKFGTTLVINTFVQRNGAKTALVTTAGFRDVMEVKRGNRPIPFDLRFAREAALVERDLRFEIEERIAADGSVVRAVDTSGLDRLCEVLRQLEVEAVAVSLINSYREPRHEASVAGYLREHLEGVYVTAGVELTREWYEYERTSTAIANAYVGPRLKDYVSRLERRLRTERFSQTFFLMASNGGAFSVERAQQQPVMLVESGPVGGCIGAGVYGRELGLPKLIAFDMGGTTAKCALVENGRFDVRSPYYVGGYDVGFPVRGSVVDIVEVGAGGGSIAAVDGLGRLSVGPRSAASDPGPVCYARGGTEPTMTDANVALARIGADAFLGGEMRLDVAAARAAIGAGVARALGYGGEDGIDRTAAGIIALGTLTMAGAIKRITIERGVDPRDFALFVFGGGGPLHGAAIARELAIPLVVVPPEPGVFSALGMLFADARIDQTRTFLRDVDAGNLEDLEDAFAAMEAEMGITLAHDLPDAPVTFERQAEMRFRGQRHTLKIDARKGTDAVTLGAAFEDTYRQRYGHVESGPLEFVNLIVTGIALTDCPTLDRLRPRGAPETAEPSERDIYFAEKSSRLKAKVYQRSALRAGFAAPGPAAVEEYGSTSIIGPDDRFEVGILGELRIFVGSDAGN